MSSTSPFVNYQPTFGVLITHTIISSASRYPPPSRIFHVLIFLGLYSKIDRPPTLIKNPHSGSQPFVHQETESAGAHSLNLRPTSQVAHCPDCGSELRPLTQCLNGEITNLSRRFQKFPTPLEHIPEDAIRSQSIVDQVRILPFSAPRRTASLPHTSSAVLTGSVNKFLPDVQPAASSRVAVGRIATSFVPAASSSSQTASAASSSASQAMSSSATPQDFIVEAHTFAMPLNEHYSRDYLSRHPRHP
ncbi:hypothetical protein B0H13DRAFT_2331825 [Mycena leptocephala]|nr:hypothetical protein B0H13DRAFT_2331825 [Mycena leptocephala]